MTVGQILKTKLQEKDYTQKQLAEESGITECGISRYFSDERIPRIDKLVRIAKVLDIDLNIFKELDL